MERNGLIEKTALSRPQLKVERERRGWTLEYVAMQINCPDPHMIGRWERGKTTPSPRYRQALCELFGKDAWELGLLAREREEPAEQAPAQSRVEQTITPPRSCFFFNTQLPCADEFYGRAIERETLFNRIYHNASTSIVGARRIGKTWLIEYLLLEAKNQLGSRFRTGYVDAMMASCSTVPGFTSRAARALGFQLSEEQAAGGLVVLEEIVETLKARGQRAILCIDEFERFRGRPGFDISFFAGLRALGQCGLSLVVASRRPLIDIVEDDGNTSGFFNIFEQLTLEPFDSDDAEEFVTAKSSLVGFNQQAQEMMMHYGQAGAGAWPPLRLQLAGKMLLEDKLLDARGGGQRYRPEDSDYRETFARRLEEKYRGVVR